MPTIKLKLKNKSKKSYKIFIQTGATHSLSKFLKEEKIGKKYAIITDSTVKAMFGIPVLKTLRSQKINAELFTFQKGEQSKNLETIEKLAEEMVKKGFCRHDAIIAVGGGVTGDIAGFLASIYMRGIPYIHIPTTLLAMVDSSIGGKTGVDLKCGKNLIGTITQPAAVFIDINNINNLPEKQIRNGLAEVIKYGVIKDKYLFKFIEQNYEKIFTKDEKTLTKIITRSAEIKAKIIQKDETEEGERMTLNYGHTYGHALEKMSNYKLLHGYALSIGMVLENKIAIKKGILKEKTAERIKNLLTNVGLPVVTMKVPESKDISSDKKREGNFINLVVPTKIGKTIIYKHPLK